MSDAAISVMSEDEFVAFELADPERHEYVDGVTRAMTGASIRHNDVALNLAVALRAAAKGTGCKVNIEGVRLKVNSRRHYYPDVLVTCEEAGDTHAHSSACLIAVDLTPCKSDPAAGSLIAIAPTIAPLASLGRYLCFCAPVP